MKNLISKTTWFKRGPQVFVSTLVLLGILLSLMQVPIAFAANYSDTFTSTPFAGNPTSFDTGSIATGLSYSCFNCDFAYDSAPAQVNALAINFPGYASITITSRDGKAFDFNSIYVDTIEAIEITGSGPEPFTISVGAGSTGSYSPGGGAKHVTQVVMENIGAFPDFNVNFDNVDVELDVPGMDIQGNGTTIVNGDSTPASGDDTDFGSVTVGVPVSKTFTIRSIGDANLDLISSPYVTKSGSADITVTSQPTTDPIASGGSDTFTVQCNPSTAGSKTATLSIANNSEANPYTFDVSCTGTVDTTPPSLTSFTYQTPATSPTNTSTLVFRATFDESVQNVTTGDFSVDSTSTATVTGVSTISASTYDVTVSGGDLATFSGTVGLNLAGSQDIQDLAGNALPAGEPTTDETYLVDHIAPSVPTGLSPADNVYTNNTSPTLSWDASTDAGGSGLRTTSTYRVVVNGTPSKNYYTANTSYTPTLQEGIFTWHVYARDNAGNTSAWSSLYTLNIDTTKPNVTINQASGQSDPTNSSPVVFTAVFDEPINIGTFTNADISTVGSTATTGTVTVSEITPPGDGTTFKVSVVVSGDGIVTATIPADGVEDRAGNTNTVSTSIDNEITWDGTAPTLLSITRQTPVSSPTNADSLTFRATFNEDVQNVDATDFTATGTTATIAVTQNSASEYDLTLSGGDLAGLNSTVGVDLAGGQNIIDTAGNALPAGEPATDETYLLDNTAPGLTSFIRQTPASSPTNANSLTFRATFDVGVQNVDATDFTATGTTATIAVTQNSASEYDLTLSGGDLAGLNGTVGVDLAGGQNITDTTGNALPAGEPATDETYLLDNTAPGLTSFVRQVPASSPTNANSLTFRATFNESVQNVDATDFTATGTTATIAVTQNSASEYDLTLSGGDLAGLNGTVGVDLAGGQNITDTTGNALPTGEPATDETYLVDNTGPTVTVNEATAQADPTSASPINFTVVFSETTTNFATGDVTLSGTAGATTATVTGSGTTYNVAASGMTADGTVIASIGAGVATDAAGNNNTASTSTDNQVTFDGNPEIDIQRPAATSIADGGTDAIGNQALGTVNLTYTIDNTAGADILTVTGVTASSLSNVSNFSLDTAVPINVNGGATATFDISFDVGINGAFGFDMQIANNDADEGTYDITVSGTGTGGAPEIDIQRPAGTSIADGGSDNVGSPGVGPVTLSYTIDNSGGTEQLSITDVTAANLTNVSGFTLNTATPVNVAAGSTGTFGISYTVDAAGAFSFDLDILNNDPDEANYDIQITGTAADLVVVPGGNTSPLNGDILSAGPNMLNVQFSKEILTGAGAGSGENTANYLLVEAGLNNTFDTISCLGGVLGDDTNITVDSISYNNATFTATLNINGGAALPSGSYRLFVCGTTSIEDLFGNELNNGLSDTQVSFTVSSPASLPETGFRHGEVTQLPKQPAAKAYAETAMLLEIPKLGLSTTIVGVPQAKDAWDVTWLGNSAGYLAGSAFPTWAGNTVITGHVWDAYNNPGIFAELKTLKYGDQVQIQAWGETYTYEVRESKLVKSSNVNTVLQSEEYDWLTLVTCEFYNPFNGEYLFRRAVRAVLVSVK